MARPKDPRDDRRVTIRLSEDTHERLTDMSSRYGIPINSIASFVLGQWLDSNYSLREKMQEQLTQFFTPDSMDQSFEKILTNPAYVNLLKEIAQQQIPELTEKK